MSKLYTLKTRYYHCPDCQVTHNETTDNRFYLCMRYGQEVFVRIGEVEEVA